MYRYNSGNSVHKTITLTGGASPLDKDDFEHSFNKTQLLFTEAQAHETEIFLKTRSTRLTYFSRERRPTRPRLYKKLGPRNSDTLHGGVGPLDQDFFQNSYYETVVLSGDTGPPDRDNSKNAVNGTQLLFTAAQAYWTETVRKTRSRKLSYLSRGHRPDEPRFFLNIRSKRLRYSSQGAGPSDQYFLKNSVYKNQLLAPWTQARWTKIVF